MVPEIFAQGEPDGVRCRAMLFCFDHAGAHRLHRLSGREWPKATDALHVWIEVDK